MSFEEEFPSFTEMCINIMTDEDYSKEPLMYSPEWKRVNDILRESMMKTCLDKQRIRDAIKDLTEDQFLSWIVTEVATEEELKELFSK